MKMIVLPAVFFIAISANSQSLLDALYSGKLKADTGAVLRKGDSLKIRENMAQKVTADSLRKDSIATANAAAALQRQNASMAAKDTSAGAVSTTVTSANTEVVSGEPVPIEKAAPKDNNKIWKGYIDSLTTLIKSEVITSGKIKKGAYSVLINYDIKPDGQISVSSVASDPASSFLEDQIKLRMTLESPQLNPVLGTNGQPRTVAKKQMLSFVK